MESSDTGVVRNTGTSSLAFQKWATGLLLIVGVQCWLLLGQGIYGFYSQLELVLVGILLCLIPPINSLIFVLLDNIRHPSSRTIARVTGIIAVLSTAYFCFTAWNQKRSFIPLWQDEGSYSLQIQMLAHGRLWMPQHPLADFFDSFQVIVKPVYASMYFPGASFFYVPAVWIGLPYWIISAVLSGTCVGLIYWIMTDLIDGVGGALAALMLVSLSKFREISILIIGHPAIALLTLTMVLCWLCWRRNKSPGWAAALGAFVGWAAITRPLDALIIAIPIGVDILLTLRGSSARQFLKTTAILVVPAMPFLIVQIVFNIGVTGSWHRTPFEFYADRDYPDTTLGFHPFDPSHRPVSTLPQKQKFHDEWTAPAIQRHQPENIIRNWFYGDIHHSGDLQNTLADALPSPLLTFLLPAGLLGLVCRKRLMLWLTFPLWVIAYTFYTWLLPHYAVPIMPAIILTALLGARQIEITWPKLRHPLGAMLAVAIVIFCLTQTHEFNSAVKDQYFNSSELQQINDAIAKTVSAPAVVLFHFPPDGNPHTEPVYNVDTPWPDDAAVIRAHDLGPRNVELFRYYAQIQPNRSIYLYDRGDGSIRLLGTAKELAHAD